LALTFVHVTSFQKKRKRVSLLASVIVPLEELYTGKGISQCSFQKSELNSTNQDDMVEDVRWCVLRFVRNDIAIREVGTFSFVVVRITPIAGCRRRGSCVASFGHITEGGKSINVIIRRDVRNGSSTHCGTNVISRAIGANGGVNDDIILGVRSVQP
jgi:hypothetical protein